jgi:hypothetical protein
MPSTQNDRELAKERWEHSFFIRFSSAMPDLSLNLIEQPKPPGADFKAESNGKVVGIEVTEPPSELFEALARQYKTGDSTQEILRSDGCPPGRYGVIFRDDAWHGPISIKNRALELAEAIKIRLAGATEDQLDLEPAWITHLSYMRYTFPNPPLHVTVSTAGFYPPLTVRAVQDILQKKDSKVPGYRTITSEVWLLIACSNGRPGWFELPPETAQADYVSSFDRVFFLSSMSDSCYELKVTPPAH